MSDPESSPATAEEARTKVQHLTLGAEDAGLRLDKLLVRLLPDVPRSRLYRILRKGEVRLNGKRAGPEARVAAGDVLRLPPLRTPPPTPEGEGHPAPPRIPSRLAEQIRKAIIYEDAKLLVLDKPAGIAVHGGSGLSFGVIEVLRALRPDETLELAHRLDRDTSGCLIVSRKASALRTLHALLRESQFEKHYLALLAGKWEFGPRSIDAPLRTDLRSGGERTVRVHASGKESRSDFRALQFFGRAATLAQVSLHTGRTHQIRVHAAHTGHPVAGDDKYGDERFNFTMRNHGLTRLFLHAHSLSFVWPESGQAFSVNAPLPPELRLVIDRLGALSPRDLPAPKLAPQGTENPASRSAPATQMSGRPTRAVGSSQTQRSKRATPRPSDLKPPAQSRARSRRR